MTALIQLILWRHSTQWIKLRINYYLYLLTFRCLEMEKFHEKNA